MAAEDLAQLASKMRSEWDQRARENAHFYVNTASTEWSDDEFFGTGERNIEEHILTDMGNICQGKPPGQMNVLEIGCGAGRLTRALARVFGQVYAVDVSPEMIQIAQAKLGALPNVHLYNNNGVDLAVLPDVTFDFAFSYIVFQHIPSFEVLLSYCREVARRLRPGGLFKFQVQGYKEALDQADTWLGVGVSESDAAELARASGFEHRYSNGAGTQYYWLWFFKSPDA
jgi:ubiquinone/menaquinone biosynthesis C-methylase UbiE